MTGQGKNLSYGQRIWTFAMTEFFSIVDIQEKNLKNGEVYFRFIRMCRRRGLFFGRQLKGTGRLSDGKSQ